MKDRKTLNEIAAELRQKYGFEGDVPAVLAANINRVYAAFHTLEEEGGNELEVQAAAKPVRDAIADYNDEMRMERLEAMEDMTYAEAMASYMGNQCVTGFKFSNTKDRGWIVEAVEDVVLDFYDVLKATYWNFQGQIDVLCVFADNLMKWHFKDTERAAVNRKAISPGYRDLRKRMELDLGDLSKVGKTAMAVQFTKIVANLFHGTEIQPRMINADVRYVIQTILKTKDKANNAGAFVFSNERTIVNAIFRAVYTRYNRLPYEWQSQIDMTKNPGSVEANKAMGEESLPAEKPAEVSAETVEVPAE